MTSERTVKHAGMDTVPARSPFKLYDSDKQNQAINTHKKPRVSTERSVKSKVDSNYEYSSTNSMYAGRLEAKLTELSLALAERTKQLKQVTEQRNCLKLICEKQLARLSQSSTSSELEILKEDYRLQLEELQIERQRIGELLTQINSDHSTEMQTVGLELSRSLANNAQLQQKCSRLAEQNSRLQQQADQLASNLMEKDSQLDKLREQLFERRNIEKKYRLALRQLERLDQQGHQLTF